MLQIQIPSIVNTPLVKLTGATDKDKIVKALDVFCREKLEPYMKQSYAELGNYMNVYENKMVMKKRSYC